MGKEQNVEAYAGYQAQCAHNNEDSGKNSTELFIKLITEKGMRFAGGSKTASETEATVSCVCFYVCVCVGGAAAVAA